jgi:hypothetical protein
MKKSPPGLELTLPKLLNLNPYPTRVRACLRACRCASQANPMAINTSAHLQSARDSIRPPHVSLLAVAACSAHVHTTKQSPKSRVTTKHVPASACASPGPGPSYRTSLSLLTKASEPSETINPVLELYNFSANTWNSKSKKKTHASL